jgi:hypothetical protein
MAANAKRRTVSSFVAHARSLDVVTAGAAAYASLFSEVISIQILFDPDSNRPYSYTVFGYFDEGPPKRFCTKREEISVDSDGDDEIFERPMPDGSILVYRRTTSDIKELISYLASAGVPDPELLMPSFWRKRADCTGGTKCTTKTCSSGKCSACSTGGGTYCCCL